MRLQSSTQIEESPSITKNRSRERGNVALSEGEFVNHMSLGDCVLQPLMLFTNYVALSEREDLREYCTVVASLCV